MKHARARAWTSLLAAAAAATLALAQPETDPTPDPQTDPNADTPPAEQTENAEPVIQLVPPLLAPDATPDERRASASKLVSERRLAPLRSALSGEAGDEAAAAAHEAVAQSSSAELIGLLVDLINAEPSSAGACIDTLERTSGRDALRALARLLQTTDADPARRARVAGALERRTGVRCDPNDPAPWLDWWSQAEWLPEAEWQSAIAAAFRARWLDAAQDRDAYAARTEGLYRRLYSQLPPESRTALLTEILSTHNGPLRLLGLELIERSLLNGRPIDAALAKPTADALRDADPRARTLAARSLARFAPGTSRAAALAALRQETSPEAAGAILDLLAASEPDETSAERALAWLSPSTDATDAAARLITRALDASHNPGNGFDHNVREQAFALIETNPTPALVELLAAVGRDAEGDRIAALLPEAPPPLASACVRALVKLPGGYARLSEVADLHPDIRPSLAELLSRHASDLGAYRFVQRLGGLEFEAQRAALTRIWASLPPASLLPAARETSSPALRASLLRGSLQGEGVELPADTRRPLILLYAETLSLAGAPEQSLEAIGLLPPDQQAAHGAELASLALGRLHEQGAPAPEPTLCAPGLWFRAIERLSASSPEAARAMGRDETMRAYINADQASSAAFETLLARLDSSGAPAEQATAGERPKDGEGPR